MGLSDRQTSPAGKSGREDGAGKAGPAQRRTESDSSGLFAGFIFLTVLVVLIGLLIAGVVYLVVPMLSQPGGAAGPSATPVVQKATVTPAVTPAASSVTPRATATMAPTARPATAPGIITPTIIVRPEVPPDLMDRSRLKRTDNIVGLWKSTDVLLSGQPWSKSDNYELTIYNDNSYVIHDRASETYVIGKWARSGENKFTVNEPGAVDSTITAYDTLHLRFNYHFSDISQSHDIEQVKYDRIYYPGFYDDRP